MYQCLISDETYRNKATMSSIPWEIRVTWYNKAQENFPEFAHCKGLWVFEEALRQRMSGRGMQLIYINKTCLKTNIIFFI